jgi:hypothetical protein
LNALLRVAIEVVELQVCNKILAYFYHLPNFFTMILSTVTRIRHTVVFKLKHPKGSSEEQAFLAAAQQLASIPGVEKFEALKQISQKNNFEWGLSMEFANLEVYEQYNHHPDHVAFVEQRWLQEVEDFLEIDYQL